MSHPSNQLPIFRIGPNAPKGNASLIYGRPFEHAHH
jgi:hypothetical protein